ncbi:alpha/beta hydrolase [Nocardia sp. CDC159]|uniref:Alpha/beta hydrolase n=1 Tax=Nocardia pulmonis TaxID=2951408 RepID=A0A9X2E5S6_9NOCA|nr:MULTISPECIES: alpha/beta fold hydrolase [Nocardia]MCM6774837.1 alpha/beta hydrolase [Nocardia pulmonis]MCM6789768.1 alpha/beta hydrolase [Nocardia sp. CDC159]
MLVKLPETVTGLRRGADALNAAYSARLRSRTYATAALNVAPSPEIVSVTTADGARLRVHAYGPADRDVLVLIHGWSCCLEYWNPQINAFAGEYRVVSYDQRGHGESTLGSERFSADQLAGDLSAVLDAVLRPGQRAVLVGHSMGGMTIQAWARRFPEQVAQRASAIMLATTAASRIPGRAKIIPLLNELMPAPTWVAQALFGAPVPLPGTAAARGIFRNRIMTAAATDEAVAFGLAIVRSCNPAVRGAVARDLAKLDLAEAAAHITVPTVVVAGEFDKLLPQIHSREIADLLAANGSLDRYVLLPTGHLPNIEAPHEFNTELHRLIRLARTGVPGLRVGGAAAS